MEAALAWMTCVELTEVIVRQRADYEDYEVSWTLVVAQRNTTIIYDSSVRRLSGDSCHVGTQLRIPTYLDSIEVLGGELVEGVERLTESHLMERTSINSFR